MYILQLKYFIYKRHTHQNLVNYMILLTQNTKTANLHKPNLNS